MLLDALGRRLDPPGRPRLGQRPLLPVPRRHGLRRRRRRAGRAASCAQALRRPPAVRLRRAFDTWFRHYDRTRPALRRAPHRRHDRRRRLRSPCASTRTRTPTSGNRPFNVAPDADPRPRARAASRSARSTSSPLARARGIGARRAANACAAAATSTTAPTSPGSRRRLRPFPYQVDGDYLGETTELDVPPRARRPRPRACPLSVSGTGSRARRGRW